MTRIRMPIRMYRRSMRASVAAVFEPERRLGCALLALNRAFLGQSGVDGKKVPQRDRRRVVRFVSRARTTADLVERRVEGRAQAGRQTLDGRLRDPPGCGLNDLRRLAELGHED